MIATHNEMFGTHEPPEEDDVDLDAMTDDQRMEYFASLNYDRTSNADNNDCP